ncbi:glutaredoxin family protein [Parahaliea mediterranea]|uniref:Glutaredoxin family protein n=1 Tax=Parahaliea mediterranea TaxID=651086 RepID=A0A939DHZ9_9GAMM|nr:glutaredoxin family protein [Parahaliea mediterranea]MBN7798373.1 glutaredoxin family protein [Parahaliea mediterranea]
MSGGAVFELLGTSACHLCEQAEDMLRALQGAGLAFDYVKCDISEDDALFERYGLLIPVLRAPGGQKELHWPFEPEALVAFLVGVPSEPQRH